MAGGPVTERGVLTAPAEAWDTAVQQARVIGLLAGKSAVGLTEADAAAAKSGISRRQVYVLFGRWRAGGGVVSDLLPGRSSGGRGGGRLPDEVETLVQDVLHRRYLTGQRRPVAAICKEIARQCRARGLRVLSRELVVRRISQSDPVDSMTARQRCEAARPLRSAGGVPPEITEVLEQVQIDHTPMDVIVVDDRHRLPIGR
ncbi:helix-turn-helix domain-containing protein [Streptomyces sp. NBC_01007]|nr:helix-turn-helix domain-containing protein [Streptomyces sp. NBC_01007]